MHELLGNTIAKLPNEYCFFEAKEIGSENTQFRYEFRIPMESEILLFSTDVSFNAFNEKTSAGSHTFVLRPVSALTAPLVRADLDVDMKWTYWLVGVVCVVSPKRDVGADEQKRGERAGRAEMYLC